MPNRCFIGRFYGTVCAVYIIKAPAFKTLKEVHFHGKMRYLQQRCYLWYQGFSLTQKIKQNLEAQRYES